MSRLATMLTAAAISLASLGLVACGDTDPVSDVRPEPSSGVTSSNGSGVDKVAMTTPTCAQLRVDRIDYDEQYDRLRCTDQRRRLCQGLAPSTARYDAYRCITLQRTSAKKKAAAKRRAAAKKKAAAKRRATAKKQAAAKKVTAAKKSSGSKSSSGGSNASSGGSSASSGSSSSSRPRSSSSSSSGSSSSGSSSSGSRRR